MKVSKLTMGAVIPTRQYENIQPSLVLEDVEDLAEGSKMALDYITTMVNQFSDHGKLPEISSSTTKTSFNEDLEIEFDPIQHTYFYKGTKLESATGYIGQFYKPFNGEMIAKNCEKKYGVPAKEIQSMWRSNGDLARDFGELVHKALEHYDIHKANGETIEQNTEKEKPHMPKHPFLRGIIEDFYALDHDKGEVVPEALLTNVENGYCGHADRVLITGKKKCRVQDYKVNVDAEMEDKGGIPSKPWSHLAGNKLTKYQLQMSFYANMLQKSGWTVEGLDAFVYEEEWKHYKLDVLDLI